MQLAFAFVADAATVDAKGKLNVLGIFDNIYSQQFPFTYQRMVFCCKITARSSEAGNHSIKIVVIDEDGQNIIKPLEGNVEITQQGLDTNIALELHATNIPKPGTYTIDVVVDSQHIGSTNIKAIQVNG